MSLDWAGNFADLPDQDLYLFFAMADNTANYEKYYLAVVMAVFVILAMATNWNLKRKP